MPEVIRHVVQWAICVSPMACADRKVTKTGGISSGERRVPTRLGKIRHVPGTAKRLVCSWAFTIAFKELIISEPTRNTGLLFKCLESEAYCCAYVGGSLRDWPKQADTNLTCCNIDNLIFKAPDPVVYATASFSNRVSTQSTSTSPSSTYLSTISQDLTATHTAATSSPAGDSALSGGNTQQDSSSAGLSTDAKVGLGVSILLGVIGLAAVGAFFWLRRRRQSSGGKGLSGLYVSASDRKGDMPPYQETAMNHHGAAVYRQNVPSPQMAAELPAAVEPTELPPHHKHVNET